MKYQYRGGSVWVYLQNDFHMLRKLCDSDWLHVLYVRRKI